jgi:protein-disulfide isomerase
VALVAIIVSTNNAPTASVEAYGDIPFERLPDGGFVLGSPDAPITIVEFADFACPHCQDYSVTMQRFVEKYVATGMARLEYRMFISAADPVYGPYTAQLAECAEEQRDGAFWPAHDILFELGSRARFNDTTARTLADRLDLNYSELLSCAGSASQYQTDIRVGQAAGIQSTPSVMVRFGEGAPQFIRAGETVFNRGPVPYDLLEQVVLAAQQ